LLAVCLICVNIFTPFAFAIDEIFDYIDTPPEESESSDTQTVAQAQVKIELAIAPSDYNKLAGQLIEVSLYENESPPGAQVNSVDYDAELLLPERETQTTGSFTAQVEIPININNAETKYYHIRAGYNGGKLFDDYASIQVTVSGMGTVTVRSKSSSGLGSLIYTTTTPTINAELPDPVDSDLENLPGGSDNLGNVVGNNPSPALGSDSDSLLYNDRTRDFIENNKPGYGERFTAGILLSAVNWVMNLFRLSDPVLLVFGKNPRADDTDDFLAGGLYGSDPRDDLILGTFPEPFFNSIAIIYTAFEKLLPIPLVLILVIIAVILMLNSGTVEGRNQLKEYLRAFLVALIAVRFGYILWHWVFELNYIMVDLIWAHMMDNGVVGGFFLDMIWGTGRAGFEETVQLGSLPLAILLVLAVFMTITLNFQYTVRMIILGLLIMVFPIVAVLSVFPSFRNSLSTWVQEFIANVFTNFAHALALGGFFLTIGMPGIGKGVGFWLCIAYFFGLPTIVGVVRQLIGLDSRTSGLGTAGAMLGVMAAVNLARMVMPNRKANMAAAGGDNVPDSGMPGTDIPTPSTGTVLKGATTTVGKVAQGAYNVGRAIAPVAKTATKIGLGATAAMTGGIISGMATGNPMAGIAVGGMVGGLAGRGIDRLASGAGTMINTTAETINSGGGMTEIIDKTKTNVMNTMMNPQGIVGKATSSAGWGLMRASNAVAGKIGKEVPFKSVDAMDANKDILAKATEGMRTVKPDLEIATAQFDKMKAQYGKGSQWYNINRNPQTGKVVMPDEYTEAEQVYNKLKAQHDSHRVEALRASNNLKDYTRLKEYTSSMHKDNATYSARRGQL